MTTDFTCADFASRPPTERDYTGFDQNMHASFAGLPDLVVPSMQHLDSCACKLTFL